MRKLCLIACTAVAAGCGTGAEPEDLADRWARALDAEQWTTACALVVDADRTCADDLRATFGNSRVRLLPAGGYNNGGVATDNRSKFAVTSDRGDTGYFEIAERGDKTLIDLKFTSQVFDGP